MRRKVQMQKMIGKSKRILTMVLALVMAFTMFPATALAVDTDPVEPPSVIDLTQNLYSSEDNIISDEELAEILASVEPEPLEAIGIMPLSLPVVEARWGVPPVGWTGNSRAADEGVQASTAELQLLRNDVPQPLDRTTNGINIPSMPLTASGEPGVWWETSISTVGLEDIQVEWQMRSTATGPRDWRLEFSTDRNVWTEVQEVVAENALLASLTVRAVHLPEEAEGYANLYLRWFRWSNFMVNGNQTTGSILNHQMASIRIRSGVERAIPIAEANTRANGTVVTVEGYATNVLQAAGGGLNNVSLFLQDGTGANDGIQLNNAPASMNFANLRDNRLRVTGTIAVSFGRNQITVTEIENLGAGTAPAAAIAVADLAPPAYRFMRVSLTHAQILSLAPPAGGAANTVQLVGASGQNIELRLLGAGTTLPSIIPGVQAGDWIQITNAYVSWFNGRTAIQLLHATVATTDPPIAPITSNPANNATLPDVPNPEVILSTATAGATIHFTLNGGAPQSGITPVTIPINNFPGVGNYATVVAYATLAGHTTTTPATFTFYQYEPFSGITIAEANAAPGGTVTVRGYVTGNDGTGRIFLQDSMEAFGGIMVQGTNVNAYLGQWIEVTGTRMQQWAQPAINNATVTPIAPFRAPIEAVELPVATLAAGRPGPWNSMLVTFRAEIREREAATGLGARHVLEIEPRTVIRGTLPTQFLDGSWVRVSSAIPHWNGTEGNIQMVVGWNSNATIEGSTAPQVTDPIADPPSGSAILINSFVNLSTTSLTPGAVIEYSLNGAPEVTSTTDTVNVQITAFDQTGDTATIRARAVLPDPSNPGVPLDYSLWQIFTYTQAAVANVVPDRESGRIAVGATLTLTTVTPGADIFVTIIRNLGAGAPDEEVIANGALYVGGIIITDDMFRPGQGDTLQITAWATAPGMADSTDLVLDFTEQIRGGEQIFFGQLHAHSLMSDCHRSLPPEAAFAEARDVAGLDFFALTDHSNYFNWAPIRPGNSVLSGSGDTPESPANPFGFNLGTYNIDRWYLDNNFYRSTVTITGDPRQNGIPNYQWERGNRAAREAMRPGNGITYDFIAINGFEFTWGGGPGHMNTFNTTGWVCRRNSYLSTANNDLRLLRYYELLRNTPESISMFNHPGTTFGNFNNFAHFCPETALRIPLLEAANGEGAIGSGSYFPAFEQYVMALDRGWLVAPANSQDNHQGDFGWANEGRVAIHTNDFTEAGMWQAFRDRAVYFTEIRDIEIHYSAHFAGAHPIYGEPMGSIIQHRPNEVTFQIAAYIPAIPRTVQQGIPHPRVRDTYTITRMELITNGGVVLADHVWTGSVPVGTDAIHEVTLNNPEPGYYFLRVIAVNSQGRQRTNMTAPIWIGRSVTPIVGISEVVSDTFMPVTAEELTLTAHFFNDQLYPVTVEAIQWIRNGVVYHTAAPNLLIPAESTAQYATLAYTPTEMGNVGFTVRAIMSAGGWSANRVYYGFIDLFVRDSTRVGFIGIDGAHFNEYVDGNRRDSFTNFARMALAYDLVTVIFRNEAEIIAAANNPQFQLLLFSSPGRHSSILSDPERGEHRDFSAATIAAVGAFVERGGTLAVAGHGNFNETGGQNRGILEHAPSFQLNQLLAAAGSNIRIGDTSHTAPAGYRTGDAHQHDLRFRENFNLSNPFMEGVLYHGHPAHPAGQLYSNFSSGALYVVNNPAIIPRNAADVTSHVLSGDIDWDALGVDPMVFAHPGSWTVDSNRQPTAPRTKYPTPWTIGNINSNPDGGSFPRYNHPEVGMQTNPGNVGAAEAGLLPGIRPQNADTADGQHLMAASQFVNANGGTVLAFASNFFSNFDVRPDLDFYGQVPPNMNFNIAQNLFAGVAPAPVITDIADVWAMAPGEWVTIQGVLTSGIRGSEIVGHFNSNSVYIQDASGRGINLFEVTDNNAPGMQIGQTWRATGFISYYQGERQLNVHLGGSMRRVTADHVDVAPRPVTIPVAASDDTRGTLVSVQGIATDISPAGFTLTGATGESILVHIGSGVAVADLTWLQEGMAVSVVGFSSMGAVGANNAPRIRVRDRAEITGIDVFVGSQVGTIQAGQAGQVTVTITTSPNIPAGSIITIPGLPPYAELVGTPTVGVDGVTTITIVVTAPGLLEGSHDLQIVITNPITGDAWSAPFTFVIAAPQELDPNRPGGGGGGGIAPDPDPDPDPDPEPPWFVDVSSEGWYYYYIRKVFANNVMLGMSETHFEPGRNFTRAMAVATLYRMYHGETAADLPYANTRVLFDDVSIDAWHASYVAWAYDMGIVLGIGGYLFAPNDYVTREQLAVMKHRFIIQMTDLDAAARPGTQWANFTDRDQISDWAIDAMIWANYHELIQGTPSMTLDPLGNASRAQVAAILARAIGTFNLN